MKYNLFGDTIKVTPDVQEKIENRLSFLEKYFVVEDDISATLRVKILNNELKVEVSIPTKIGLLRAEAINNDFYTATDIAIDKLEQQITRQKSRLNRRHKEKLSAMFADEQNDAGEVDPVIDEEEDTIVRTKLIKIDRMDLEEAILRMEMLGHSFFIYKDEETNAAAVVYKRDNGGYGLIETED